MRYFVEMVDHAISVISAREKLEDPSCGAVVTFEGVVRDFDEGEIVSGITYESYVPMAKKEMEKIAQQALSMWPEIRVGLIHRLGTLKVGEVSVVVLTASPHRKEAFASAIWIMDRLKETVPIWKKQVTLSGPQWKGTPVGKNLRTS